MAQLTFDANTGVVVPETSAVRADLVSRIQEAFKVSGSAVELDCDHRRAHGGNRGQKRGDCFSCQSTLAHNRNGNLS